MRRVTYFVHAKAFDAESHQIHATGEDITLNETHQLLATAFVDKNK
jgi:hypothetical protein